MKKSRIKLPFEVRPKEKEIQEIDLVDERLNKRAKVIFEAWSRSPESSLPQVMKTPAQLEGAYRFFNNTRVDSDAVMASHLEESWKRAEQSEQNDLWILAVQDTTEMRFGGSKQRHGLGSLINKGHGFYLHVGLLVGLIETDQNRSLGIPLGIGASEILVRPQTKPKRPSGVTKKQWEKIRHFSSDNEFLRWKRVSKSLEDTAVCHNVSLIHVADREADEFDWLTTIKERGGRFVVRQSKNRRLVENEEQSSLLLNELMQSDIPKILATRQVRFEATTTNGGRRRRNAARKGRTTQLEIKAVSTKVKRPGMTRSKQKELEVNVVLVREVNPPEGETAIQWKLLTSEKIETEKDVLKVVDAYCSRWLVEEFFKALKTGCNYERLQLETLHGLKIALAFCFGIAWHLLLLRTLARDAENIPASAVVTEAQWLILSQLAQDPDNPWAVKMPQNPNISDLLYAVARMGGHIRSNGPPGWILLGRGFEELNKFIVAQRWLQKMC